MEEIDTGSKRCIPCDGKGSTETIIRTAAGYSSYVNTCKPCAGTGKQRQYFSDGKKVFCLSGEGHFLICVVDNNLFYKERTASRIADALEAEYQKSIMDYCEDE